MRSLILLAALVVLALAIVSDGAPKLARRRRESDFIQFNRDSAFVSQQLLLQQQQQQQQQRQQFQAPKASPLLQSRRNGQQHDGAGSRVVFPTNTQDYEDHDDQIVAGVNSLEGLIQGDFVPGLIYAGQPEAAPSAGAEAVAAVGQVATAGILPQASNPASRCILCDAGTCPACYRMDQNGVCRHIFGCDQ